MKNLMIIFIEAALYLSGAGSVEELSQDAVERFEHFERSPLQLNNATARVLRQSGLLTDYQIASITDYLERSGEILSWTELSAVDGFGEKTAHALSHFCTLSLSAPPGSRQGNPLRASIQARAAHQGNWNVKAKGGWDSGLSGSLALKNGSLTSAGATYRGARWSVTAGSFNARFGQGLAQWSGFRITTLSTVDAFALSATGLSPTTSYSSVHLAGVAADVDLKAFTLSAFAAREHIGADITWRSRRGTWSISSVSGSPVSLSARTTLGRFTLFGEMLPGSILAGTFLNLAYDRRAALRITASPSNCETALGVHRKALEIVGQASFNPAKSTSVHRLTVLWKPEYGSGAHLCFRPELRTAAKYRPSESAPWRVELRASLETCYDEYLMKVRFDVVRSKNTAWQWYVESGYRSDELKAYVRAGLFRVDDWADRIYVYERDVSGTFNVPACYGRGYSMSAVLKWQGLEFRLGTVRYPAMPDRKGKLDAKLQYTVSLH